MQSRALFPTQGGWSDAGKSRLPSVKGDPFLFARWERVVFLHFALEPENLRPQIPTPFALELYDGVGVISLVAVTMRRFRPVRPGSIAGWPFALISRQRFLNLRTYVRLGDEAGALFLWGWLSQPLRLPFPSGMFGLPYAFATLRFEHLHESGELGGLATTPVSPGRFAYRARVDARSPFAQCRFGTLDEFALERYTGFFCRGDERFVFRVWHPPWLQAPIAAEIEDRSLLDTSFPWFKRARLIGGSYAPGFEQLWLGKAHHLPLPRRRRRGLSTFFEMP
jgi:uncharacterized protein YqjF (DUF2071 family)